MKTIVYFFITNIIATGALLSAMVEHKNVMGNYIVAFGVWALFLWGCYRRSKEADERKQREQRLDDYIRMRMRDRR